MTRFRPFLLILGLVFTCNCDIELRIYKHIYGKDVPILDSNAIVEKLGTEFELNCKLYSTTNTEFDEHLVFTKGTTLNSHLVFTNAKTSNSSIDGSSQNSMQNYYSDYDYVPDDISKAVLRFAPFKASDEGKYVCGSTKYKMWKILNVLAEPAFTQTHNLNVIGLNLKKLHDRLCVNKFICGDRMTCISDQYVCDGKKDCKDGSDERCDGDPCQDKLKCENGRCIPKSWCCDKHIDPNCTVNYKHPCCKVLVDTYTTADVYQGYNMERVKPSTGGMSYLFFSLFILTGVLVTLIAIILIMSKIIFGKKLHCTQQRNILHLHDIPLRTAVNSNVRSGTTCCYCTQNERSGPPSAHRLTSECLEASEPLIITRQLIRRPDQTDQPPSYADVVNNLDTLCEPPPPYSSRECLDRTQLQRIT